MNQIESIADDLITNKHAVVLTGAGVSTPSGIPDFRSKGGLWERYNPDTYANLFIFLEDPSYYWKMARETTPLILNAKPNIIHYSIVELEKLGIVDVIITQNIDFLHQRAGSKNVIEVHGTYETVTCMKCREKRVRRDIVEQLMTTDCPPLCSCGGIFAPDVILFNQPLDPGTMQAASTSSLNCKSMIVIGSSLVVSPANTLPFLAQRNGAMFYIFNNSSTPFDSEADGIILGNAEKTIPKLVEIIKNKIS
ncbi:MAG: NAD-dependent deacetylase [Candidatus Hodarchaeota archaeon]